MSETVIKYMGVFIACVIFQTVWNSSQGVNVSDIGMIWYTGNNAMAALAGLGFAWALK